jgi:hypothetical protein
MGIHDRDYWREHHRTQSRGTRPLRAAASRRALALPAWLFWLLLILGGAFAAKLWNDFRRAEPFPLTGQVHWFVSPDRQPLATLTLQAPAVGSANFVVQLDTWEAHTPVAMVPVRSAESATVQVPLGRYRMTIHKGLAWQGPSRLFGFNSESREAVHPLELYRVGNTVMGHRIQLETLGGNMETRPARSH